jgi:hypothetical protein
MDSSNNQLLFMMFLIYIFEKPKITRRKLTRLNNVTWLMTSRLSIYGCELFKSLRKMETDYQNCLSPKLFAPKWLKFTCRNLIWDKVEISLRIKLGAFAGRKDWEKMFNWKNSWKSHQNKISIFIVILMRKNFFSELIRHLWQFLE